MITANKFDNVVLNINEEFKKQNQLLGLSCKKKKQETFQETFFGFLLFFKGLFLVLLYRLGILQRLFYVNFCLGWFYEFKKFWVNYLGNRNIDVLDFHFLRNSYRAKFQEVALDHSNEKNSEKFLEAWQKQGNIFYLFQSVWNYGKKAYLDCWLFAKFVKKDSHILEYGCSIAPITTGFLKYFSYKNLNFTIADIPQISFLYAKWKFAQNPRVNFIEINPCQKNNLTLDIKYNAIFCLTVFEHLPNPIDVAEDFFNHLANDGILIFDYIKEEAFGLDSQQSMAQRSNVLKFIAKNFKIIKGKIDFENSMGITIVQKL